MDDPLDDGTLDELYQWLYSVPFSRPRKNLARDFSDGILVAELVAHFLPRYVDLHHYTSANSLALKRYNWELLNKNVFAHLNYQLTDHMIKQVISCRPGTIEFILMNLRLKIDVAVSQQRFKPTRYRSRSSSRANSTLSLNTVGCSDDSSSISAGTSATATSSPSHSASKTMGRRPREPAMNIHRFAVATPTGSKDQLCEDLVPARLLHQVQQDLLSKEEQIYTMFSRVKHLERLVQLKDERIEQLTQRLDRLAQVFYQHQQNKNKSANTATPTTSATVITEQKKQEILQNLKAAVLGGSSNPTENGPVNE